MGESIRAFSRRVKATDTAVRKRIAKGTLTLEPDGTIDPVRGVQEWEAGSDPTRVNTGKPGAQPLNGAAKTIQNARAIREAFEARLVELEYKRKVGELVPLDEMEKAVYETARRVRDRLQAIAPRVAPVVASMTDADECYRAIEAEVNLALDELSDMVKK